MIRFKTPDTKNKFGGVYLIPALRKQKQFYIPSSKTVTTNEILSQRTKTKQQKTDTGLRIV